MPFQSNMMPVAYSMHHMVRPIFVQFQAPFFAFDHKPILAERFKTKMCRNYELHGSCPYVHRCMFAHGEHEMRTKAQNLADNLVTEEAIKDFHRATLEGSSDTTPSATTPKTAPLTPHTPSLCYCDSCRPAVRPDGVYRQNPYKSVFALPPAAVAATASALKAAMVEDRCACNTVWLP
jgi:hypothetical protein